MIFADCRTSGGQHDIPALALAGAGKPGCKNPGILSEIADGPLFKRWSLIQTGLHETGEDRILEVFMLPEQGLNRVCLLSVRFRVWRKGDRILETSIMKLCFSRAEMTGKRQPDACIVNGVGVNWR
ncbi:hypothetical protein ACFPLB_11515 [Aquamicrobium segne]|uniref:Uncharacterized protein n=1 Tax=Aquamicrobium segne TaxID=469547 RepID=A0ABW0GYJ8_9HYPH